MKYITLRFLIWAGVLILSGAETKKCSCVPLSLGFKLNTTSGCTESFNTGAQSGISDSFCLIRESKFQNDFVPVKIDTIKIFELKSDLSTLGYPTVIRGLSNGDSLEFTFSNQTNTSIAGGIQFMIKGVNKNGDSVTQDSIVAFTNNCSHLVFHEGDQVGFLTVFAVGDPSSDTCSASSMDASRNVSLSDSYGGCRHGSNGKGCDGNSNGDSSECEKGGCGGGHSGSNSDEGSKQEDNEISDSGSGNNGGSSHGDGGNSGCKKGNCWHAYGSWDSESFFSISYSYSLSYSHSYHYKPKAKVPPSKKGGVDNIIVKQKVPKISTTDQEQHDVDMDAASQADLQSHTDAEMPMDIKPSSHADVKKSMDKLPPKGSSITKSSAPPMEKKTTIKVGP